MLVPAAEGGGAAPQVRLHGPRFPESHRHHHLGAPAPELLEIAAEYDLLILEDVPYRWLRFRGEAPPMIAALERRLDPRPEAPRRVISLYTFSKILAPGLRLGWITGDARLIDLLVQAKQATDLCTGALVQMLAEESLRRGLIQARICPYGGAVPAQGGGDAWRAWRS